jgi:hypothetical protein
MQSGRFPTQAPLLDIPANRLKGRRPIAAQRFAFAPSILGVLRDIEDSYTLPFAVMAGMQLAASLIVIAYRAK